jgi:hypothetical protein
VDENQSPSKTALVVTEPPRVVPANLDPLNSSLFTSVVSISGHLHILVQIGDFLQCHCCSFDPPLLHVSGIVSSIHRVHG